MLKKAIAASVLLIFILLGLTFYPIGSEDTNPEMEIYLLSNEIHTDLAFPVVNEVFDWENFLNGDDFKERPSEWIEIGWGDQQFYFEMPTWDKFTFKLAWDALFVPGQAVIHVNYLDGHPSSYANHRKIKISKKNYKKLVEKVLNQFNLKNGKPILIPNKGYDLTDNFYESYGNFSLIRTCNVWTSEVLGEADLKRPIWSPTKYGLEWIYQSIGK